MNSRERVMFGLFDSLGTEHGLYGCPFARRWERMHGEHCSCRRLAEATGAEPSSIDYSYCRNILQRRWRVVCDHIPNVPRGKVTPRLPAHDWGDPLHALLIANVDVSSD